MDDSQSKPSLFERLISRLSRELDSTEDAVNLLRQTHEQEVFDADTFFRLEKVLDLAELEVRDVVITRSQMDATKGGDGVDRIVAYIIETSHSRSFIIGGNEDEVLDILHAKDLLKFVASLEQFNLQSILRLAIFAPKSKSLNSLLRELHEQRNRITIVIGGYGGISGPITFGNIAK